jgi:hypothetical protein
VCKPEANFNGKRIMDGNPLSRSNLEINLDSLVRNGVQMHFKKGRAVLGSSLYTPYAAGVKL